MPRQTYYYGNDQRALSIEEVAAYAYRAGFRGQALEDAVAIAGRESGYRPNIHGTEAPQTSYSGDRGLWQINYSNDELFVRAGILPSERSPKIFDPLTNAKAAFLLWQRDPKWGAWNVKEGVGWVPPGTPGSSPFTGTDRNATRKGIANAAARGMLGDNWQPSYVLTPGGGGGGESAGGGESSMELPFIDIPGWGTVSDVAGAWMGVIKWLFDWHNWVRILQVIGGSIILLGGLWVMVGKEAVGMTPAGTLASQVGTA